MATNTNPKPKATRSKKKGRPSKKKVEEVPQEKNSDDLVLQEEKNEFEDLGSLENVSNHDIEVAAEESRNDQHDIVAALPDDLKKKDLRQYVKNLRDGINSSIYEMARVLYFIKQNEQWKEWEYETFNDYLEDEFRGSERTMYNYVSLHQWMLTKVQGDEEREKKAKEIGSTKALSLIPITNSENVDHWLEMATKCSVKDLKKLVQEEKDKLKKPKDESEESKEIDEQHRMTFSLYSDQYQLVNEAIKKAGQASGSKVTSNNLYNICMEYLSNIDFQDNPRKNLVSHVKNIEEMASVKVIVIDQGSEEIIHGKELLE